MRVPACGITPAIGVDQLSCWFPACVGITGAPQDAPVVKIGVDHISDTLDKAGVSTIRVSLWVVGWRIGGEDCSILMVFAGSVCNGPLRVYFRW